jgi:Leucine-rich repeat (LRR) protein
MKHISNLSFQPRLFSLIVIASLFIQTGFTTPVLAISQTSAQGAPFTTCANVTEIPQAECEALVALYNSTNGANWTINTNWLLTDTPCSWYRVGCGDGHVTSLVLGSNQLTGSIPVELGSLALLTDLELELNQLTGIIPTELGNLTKLTILSLDGNRLSGSIPIELGNLTQLTYLSLDGNQLSGRIPAELGNLSQLTFLSLYQNQLSGSIPAELGNLTQLKILWPQQNLLTGSIPVELGNLTQLQKLYLYNNQLSGSIPTELGNLTQLTELKLESNQLSGSIPTQLGNLTQLKKLQLHNNQLSGSIPSELGNLIQLTYLSLGGNQLTGNIPVQLGNLTHLTDLGLGINQLTGNIPAELGNLTQLQSLKLHDNQLSGEFPASITNLVNLTELYFDCWLTTSDPAVIAFLNEKSPEWQANQCVPNPLTLKGFYQPVDMNGVYNNIKGGRTVPLKFEIFSGSSELTDITYIKSLTYAQTSCDANAITDDIEITATGGMSLRYADGQFIYNWKTPKTAGMCYRVTMTAMDGSTLVAYFKLK